MTTVYPAFASSRLVTAPMPWVVPVITAILPWVMIAYSICGAARAAGAAVYFGCRFRRGLPRTCVEAVTINQLHGQPGCVWRHLATVLDTLLESLERGQLRQGGGLVRLEIQEYMDEFIADPNSA